MDSFLRRVVAQREEEQSRAYAPGSERLSHASTTEDKMMQRERRRRAEQLQAEGGAARCTCGHARGAHRFGWGGCGACLCDRFRFPGSGAEP